MTNFASTQNIDALTYLLPLLPAISAFCQFETSNKKCLFLCLDNRMRGQHTPLVWSENHSTCSRNRQECENPLVASSLGSSIHHPTVNIQ